MKLLCPVCGKPLSDMEHSARCPQGHNFDYASSGYLNLMRKQGTRHGDDKEMILARSSFLQSGHYAFLRDRLAEDVRMTEPDVLFDLGCGEGYYTSLLPAREKYGFDMSRSALIKASRSDPSTHYILASVFTLPAADCSADFLLSCFAPFSEAETARVLKPGGHFLLVAPAADHLMELKQLLYEHPYENRIKERVSILEKQSQETIRSSFNAGHQELMNLFRMTPYAWRTGENGKRKLQETESLQLTASFVIRIYRKPEIH